MGVYGAPSTPSSPLSVSQADFGRKLCRRSNLLLPFFPHSEMPMKLDSWGSNDVDFRWNLYFWTILNKAMYRIHGWCHHCYHHCFSNTCVTNFLTHCCSFSRLFRHAAGKRFLFDSVHSSRHLSVIDCAAELNKAIYSIHGISKKNALRTETDRQNNGRTNGRTDGRTHPLIELLRRN